MIRFLLLAVVVCATSFTMPPKDKPAYLLYNHKGKRVCYSDMLKQLNEADVVLFGELHDNPICHWLELSVMQDLLSMRNNAVTAGAEMFEADNQNALDSFLKGLYSQKEFAKASRLWPNYRTDYAALVNLAKDSAIPFVATNIPRRYASLVFKKGFAALDTLTDLEKSWMAPLPMPYDSTLPCYRDIFKSTGGHGGPTLPMAQATKDATMAHFILKNYIEGRLFLHFNGSYHSDHFESIVWYLKKSRPDLKIMTISTVLATDMGKLSDEDRDNASFILQIPETMTRTH